MKRTSKKQQALIRRAFAHGLANGFEMIHINKENLFFEFKLPKLYPFEDPQIPYLWGFTMEWNNSRRHGSEIKQISKTKFSFDPELRLMQMFAWQHGIFNPQHPTMTKEDEKEVEENLDHIQELMKKYKEGKLL